MTTPTVEKKLLRIDEVLEMTSLSRSKQWRLQKAGNFPAKVRLGGPNCRAVRWYRVEVEEWIANLERIRNV